jgi:transaldolase
VTGTREAETAGLDLMDPPGLRLFLDTADPAVWADLLPLGIFYGVTTNPTLLQRVGTPCTVVALRDLAARAVDLGAVEVHLQAWGAETPALLDVGRELAAIEPGVVVKVPITRPGVAAARELLDEGARVTLTGVYAVHQALIAAGLGADYAAPYLGRMNDAGRSGHDDIAAMQEILDRLGAGTRLLVASVRSLDDLVHLARRGIDTFTVSPTVAEELLHEPLTAQAVDAFEAAARQGGGVR